MNNGIPGVGTDPSMKVFYHGTRAELRPGDMVEADVVRSVEGRGGTSGYAYLTKNLDAAIWDAEIAVGETVPRVYILEPTGDVEDAADLPGERSPGHPSMTWRSRQPLRVAGEIADWPRHSPEALKAMKDGLEKLKRLGIEPIDD